MEYIEIIPLDEELNIIQTNAIISKRKSKLRNKNEEIINLISREGIKYNEDYIDNEYIEEYNNLNDFIDINQVYEETDFISAHVPLKTGVQQKIVADIDNYQLIYNIVGLDIENKDWDLLFDIIYDFYKKNNLETEFLGDMSRLNRFAISLSLLRTTKLNMECYIDAIDYIESEFLKEDDILTIKTKITEKSKNNKVIDFYEYQKRKRK